MKFVILGILIVLFIAFLVVVWKAAPNWRWYNIVAVIFTMILALVFIFPTAGILQSRSAWHQVKEKLETRAEDAEREQRRIKFGDPSNPATGAGLISMTQRLSKLGTEAGRRWRGLRMQSNDLKAITLVRPPKPAVPGVAPEEAAEQPTEPLIPESMVVYAFAEGQFPGVDSLVPTFYLGEFRVTSSTPNQVTVTPTGPLEQEQQEAITQSKAKSWSLYELLPLDGHQPFVAPGSSPSNENLFGRIDEQLVNQLLEKKVEQQSLQNYLRDGSRASQDDPPISRWVKIEFLKSHEIEVDSKDNRGALDGGFFDGGGRAVDSRLQHGDTGKVSFKTGDQITLKEEHANELIDEDIAKPIDRYYARPLNDYRFVLRRIRLRLTELATREKELDFERKVLEDAIAATVTMTEANQTDKLKLENDLSQTSKERTALQQYNQQLTDQLNETRQSLMQLFQRNQQLVERLKEVHLTITNRVDALTAVP